MKKFLVLILFILAIVTLIILLNWQAIDSAIRIKLSEAINGLVIGDFQLPEKEPIVMKLEYFDNDEILVARGISSLKLIQQNPLTSTVKSTTKENEYLAGINGGFFLQNLSHAGYLNISGQEVVSLAPTDTQLTGVFLFDGINPKIFTISEFQQSSIEINSEGFAFQTGPIIILNNQIQTGLINNSVNGQGKYLRSFIGYTSQGEVFLGISEVPMDLNDLSENLLSYFEGEIINAINLDGGTSTSIYSSENITFDFRSYKSLPFVILGK